MKTILFVLILLAYEMNFSSGKAIINEIKDSARAQTKALTKTMTQIEEICDKIMAKIDDMETVMPKTDDICILGVENLRATTATCQILVVSEKKEAKSAIKNAKDKLEDEIINNVEKVDVFDASVESLNWDSENEKRAEVFFARYEDLIAELNKACSSEEIEQLGNEILELAEKFEPTMKKFSKKNEKIVKKLQNEINE